MKLRFISVVLTILFNLSTPFSNFSQNLSPGDIAFLGFNADNPDAFSFIALKTIPANTVINFTDNGWESNNSLTTNEGHILWSSPQNGITLGEIVTITYNGMWNSSKGSVTSAGGSLSLSTDGDQIIAYQVVQDTLFIAAIHFNGTGWEENVTNTNESLLPLSLTNNVNAVAIDETDNSIYVGKIDGSQSELRAKINNPHNWFFSSTYYFQISEDDFPYNVWKSTTTEWNDASRWFTNSIPDIYDHAYIQGTRDPYISSFTNAICKKLTLAANSSLTIKSDMTGTGSLICNEVAIESGVAINVERYIPSANWHLISSPVSGLSPYDFASLSGNNVKPGTGDYDMAPYIEATDEWTPYVTSSHTTAMPAASGYSVRRTAAGTVTFTGTGIYTGNQSIGITCGATTNGWNCIGNPYTSGLKSRYFLSVNRPNLDNNYLAVYRWDENVDLGGGNYGDYTTINFSTTDADTIIALGQGFFVNSVVGGATINFTAAMQTAGGTFKSSEIPWPTIKLIAQAEGLSNVTTINFNSAMTRGLDPGFDGGKLKGNPNIALYTRLLEDNGIDFAIQALPEITTETVRIPVGIDFVPGGEISFMVETTAFPVDAQVYFEDVQAKTTTLLNAEGAKYTVTLPAETKCAGRFNLLVTKSATGVKTVTENLFNVYTNGNTITINGPATSDTEFLLYSIDGKQWISRHAGSMNQNTIDASAFPAGVYMLNIGHEGTRTAKKLILTK
jgi:hypothetical protein